MSSTVSDTPGITLTLSARSSAAALSAPASSPTRRMTRSRPGGPPRREEMTRLSSPAGIRTALRQAASNCSLRTSRFSEGASCTSTEPSYRGLDEPRAQRLLRLAQAAPELFEEGRGLLARRPGNEGGIGEHHLRLGRREEHELDAAAGQQAHCEQ